MTQSYPISELLKPEYLVAIIAGVSCAVVFLIRWIREAEPAPDPWSHEIEEQVDQPDVQPLCQRCLTPHSDTDWFCPECGLPATSTTDLMPNLWPLALGDAFRAIAAGKVRANWLTVAGCCAVSMVWLSIFFPIYLFFL